MNNIWEKINEGTFVIAEIGKNFIKTEEDQPVEVYLDNAKKLVDEAVEAGVDAVKFQTHNVEDEQANIEVVSPHFKGSDRYKWVKRNNDATPVESFWKPLKKYCEEKGIIFFSTPMSRRAAQILNDEVGVDLWKIGSGDILDFVALDYIASTDKPIIISSGMSSLEEVDKMVDFLKNRNAKFILLHCVSKYPCPKEELNLNTIEFLRDRYNVPVGFSDHSVGDNNPALIATAMGSCVIEKHFSDSRENWGSDHKVSMLKDEMKDLVLGIKKINSDDSYKEEILSSDYAKDSMGQDDKLLVSGEKNFRPLFRKALVAARDLKRGEVLKKDMIYAMRPQAYIDGEPSESYELVLGKPLNRDIKKYEGIKKDYLEL